jgi:hypothetical protein
VEKKVIIHSGNKFFVVQNEIASVVVSDSNKKIIMFAKKTNRRYLLLLQCQHGHLRLLIWCRCRQIDLMQTKICSKKIKIKMLL